MTMQRVLFLGLHQTADAASAMATELGSKVLIQTVTGRFGDGDGVGQS